MAGASNLARNNCYFLFFPKTASEYPSGSEPNTAACSKFEFPLNCQKDTETAMRLMYGSL